MAIDVVSKARVSLGGVPETMLWTLHNRAGEARRPDTYLPDPDCLRIYEAIDYDYERSFGKADDSHPMRSWLFDEEVRRWRLKHPAGVVVELACGLETQFQRLGPLAGRWVCVDVPEAIALRRRFLPEPAGCTYLEKSALDLSWLDEVDGADGVFISAQGLFMYFEEEDVKRLFRAIVARWADVALFFDVIPRWFSKKTLAGFGKTKHYTAPPMPWGVNRDEVPSVLSSWAPRPVKVETVPYGKKRGLGGLALSFFVGLPVLRNFPPCVVRVTA